MQEIELGAGQIELLPLPIGEATPERLELEAGKPVDDVLMRLAAAILLSPQHSADARDQLAWIEGLSEIVVRAELEPDDAINVFRQRREKDDRQGRILCAHVPAHVQAGAIRQHDVDHGQTDIARGDDLPECRQITRQRNLEFLAYEVLSQEVADFLVVIDDEDSASVRALEEISVPLCPAHAKPMIAMIARCRNFGKQFAIPLSP